MSMSRINRDNLPFIKNYVNLKYFYKFKFILYTSEKWELCFKHLFKVNNNNYNPL